MFTLQQVQAEPLSCSTTRGQATLLYKELLEVERIEMRYKEYLIKISIIPELIAYES